MLHLPHNIKLIRKLSGLKQDKFIFLFQSVTVAMQKSYEGGKAQPGVVYMQQLSDFSGVTTKQLIEKDLRIEDIKINWKKKDKVEEVEIQKPGHDDRADLKEAMAAIRGYNDFLQRMLESSLSKLLTNQAGNSALIGELLRRDIFQEAGGNPDTADEILKEMLRRIGPRLSSDVKDGIGADGHT